MQILLALLVICVGLWWKHSYYGSSHLPVINTGGASHKRNMQRSTFPSVAPNGGGVFFFTDGAKGKARLAALEVARRGGYALVGVQSDTELRSFALDQRKGLEPILFDVSDPAALIPIVHRLRQLQHDLQRPLSGVVINLADYVTDSRLQEHQKYLKTMEEASLQQESASVVGVSVASLDVDYKALMKGPMRLLEAMLDMVRHDANVALSSTSRTGTDSSSKSIAHEHELCGVNMGREDNMPVSRGGARLTILVTEEAVDFPSLVHSTDAAGDVNGDMNSHGIIGRVATFLQVTFFGATEKDGVAAGAAALDSSQHDCGADMKCILQSSFIKWAQASVEGDRWDSTDEEESRDGASSSQEDKKEPISITMQCAFSHVSVVTDKLAREALSRITGGGGSVNMTAASAAATSSSHGKNIEAAGQQTVVKKVTTKTTKKRGYGPAVSRVRTVNVRHVDVLPNSKLLSARYQQIERELYMRAAARAIKEDTTSAGSTSSSNNNDDDDDAKDSNSLLDDAITASTRAVVHSMMSSQPQDVY